MRGQPLAAGEHRRGLGQLAAPLGEAMIRLERFWKS
jgi:hypothetical protein